MASSQLTVFVSSRMEELAPERLAIKAALEELEIDGWVFEKDAGARAQSIQQTYLEEVEKADLYIGLFWKGYGDYTIEEFDCARRLHKDCLLYEKRTDIEGCRDERLEKWLGKLDDVETGLTRKWFNTPAELKEFVKHDVARWQAEIVRRYKVAGAPRIYQPPQPVEDRTRRDLSTLIDKVEQFWIKGVLEKSVHHQFLIELGKEKVAEAITHPWETVLELPNQAEATVAIGGNITESFEEVEHYLLILGQPGSGKTITLLQLARDLLALARQDPAQPIPTVFNLSSWANKGESIVDWMVRELSEKYQIPKKIGKVWLDQHLLLPLLDGLDEVTPDLQDDCVRAINNFVQECPSGLVVCSRLQEYMSLPVRLKLNGAICLQPLSVQQVEDYLEKAGPSLAALRQALESDNNLQELIQTPLMLSITSLAYEHGSLQSLQRKSGDTVESLRDEVFETYIKTMVQRKGKSGRVYSKEKLDAWLGWLARQMKSHSLSIFLIEQLQADWLGTRRQRFFYILISRLLAGLFLGSSVGLAVALLAYSDNVSGKEALSIWLAAMGAGVIIGVVSVLITCVKEWLNEKVEFVRTLAGWRRSLMGIVLYISTWLVLGGITTIVVSEGSIGTIVTGFFLALAYAPNIGLIHWFLFEARSDRHRSAADITTVEILKWSWKGAFKTGFKGAMIVSLVLLPIALISAYLEWGRVGSFSDAMLIALLTIVIMVLPLGIGAAVIGFLFGGLKEGIVEKKTKPNQGVRLTMRNAIVAGVTIGLLVGMVIVLGSMSFDYLGGITPSLSDNALFLVEIGLIIGIPVAFRNGLYDAIKHYTLRVMLVSSKYIPRHYIRVLNYAAGLILLQKVGGSYIFIHRTLLEHYAAKYGLSDKATVQG
jgi:eukaryotic-like serine/threonine-protein kinase